MNRSLLYHAFGVRKGYDYVRTVYGTGCIRFVLGARELLVCPRCHGAQVKRKGRRFRELQTVPIGLKRVWLVTEVPRASRYPPFCPALRLVQVPAPSLCREPVGDDDSDGFGGGDGPGIGLSLIHIS